MTYLEAIEDALDRFPDMPVEMRQAFYAVLLVGDVTEEEAADSRKLYSEFAHLCPAAAFLLPTLTISEEHATLYTKWVVMYLERIK